MIASQEAAAQATIGDLRASSFFSACLSIESHAACLRRTEALSDHATSGPTVAGLP